MTSYKKKLQGLEKKGQDNPEDIPESRQGRWEKREAPPSRFQLSGVGQGPPSQRQSQLLPVLVKPSQSPAKAQRKTLAQPLVFPDLVERQARNSYALHKKSPEDSGPVFPGNYRRGASGVLFDFSPPPSRHIHQLPDVSMGSALQPELDSELRSELVEKTITKVFSLPSLKLTRVQAGSTRQPPQDYYQRMVNACISMFTSLLSEAHHTSQSPYNLSLPHLAPPLPYSAVVPFGQALFQSSASQ
nr:uncharacterized protein LOC118086867 [Zootoca vivipara]